MENSQEFLKLILDSITEHIVVIDETGCIIFVNQSWSDFGEKNASESTHSWEGLNYLAECDKAKLMGDEFGTKAAGEIRKVIDREKDTFYLEYPCHSPDEKRWFMMRVSPFQVNENNYFVISHQDITARKLAEETVKNLARVDGLTGIPNRRTFNEFLSQEIKRCSRLGKPICLAILDLDYFKELNDTYGHLAGDNCLMKIAKLLEQYCKRPSDICARYGGEEFALVWGDSDIESVRLLVETLLSSISQLQIPNEQAPTGAYLTASIGLAEMFPDQNNTADELINLADELLYQAKQNGRNRIEVMGARRVKKTKKALVELIVAKK